MINKKRLIMMSVAASMMLPTNLAYLSVATPVLATDGNEGTGDQSTDSKKPIPLTAAADVPINTASKPILENGKTYKLMDSIELSTFLTIPEGTKAVIDLNGKTLSCPRTCLYLLANTSLEIIGPGYIKSTDEGPDARSMIILKGQSSQLNVGPGVEISTPLTTQAESKCGVILDQAATKAVVNMTGVTLSGLKEGVSVNGNMPATDLPIINLTQVTITGTDTGVYQAGSSIFNVVNCNINATKTGIETRAGTLNVSGGTITGGQNIATSKPNSDGTTSANVGIAIAQHSRSVTPNCPVIDVNISGGAKVSGGAALLIADPQENLNKDSEQSEFKNDLYKKISVVVADSTLTGTKHDVAYTADKIGFTLIGNDLNSLKIKKCTPDADNKLDEGVEVKDAKNITLIPKDPSSTANATTSIKIETLPTEVGSITENTLTPAQKEAMEKALTTQIQQNAKAAFTPVKDENGTVDTTPQKLGYTYKVTVNPEVAELPNGYYSVQAKLEAVLDETSEDSVVRLYIPRTQKESAEIMSETATSTDGHYDPGFALDATLNAVADMTTGKFKAEKIKKILNTLPEAANFDENAVNKFDYVTFTGNHVVADTETPVVFTADQAVIPNNTSGGSHKPKPKPEQPAEEPVVATPTTMYRLYNKLTGEHLYTIDKNERDHLLTSDTWSDEGQGWIAPSVSDYPVYRLLNPNNGDHHYTTDKNEFDTLPTYGWIAEGVAFFSADKNNPENVILHRLYNPNAEGAGSHHYTADTNERDTLVAKGWTYEGLAWAGLPESK